MNRGILAAVRALKAPALGGLVVLTSACVQIEGGAVEARWTLRDARGIAVECGDEAVSIGTIRFILAPMEGATVQEGTADPCAGSELCLFECARGVGTTPFAIPQGEYAMRLQPFGSEGNPLGDAEGITVPPPVVREVRHGELTNLNVNLIIVERDR